MNIYFYPTNPRWHKINKIADIGVLYSGIYEYVGLFLSYKKNPKR